MKNVARILLIIFFTFLISPSVSAVESNIDEYDEEFDYSVITDSLTDEAAELLAEIGITEISYDSIFGVSFQKVFNAFLNVFTNAFFTPFKVTAYSVGILLLTSIAESFCNDDKTVSFVGGSALSLGLAVPLATTVSTAFSVLEALFLFTTAFSGVFSAIVSASGNVSAGVTYAAAATFANTFFSGLLTNMSDPVVSLMCGLGFLSCFDIYNVSQRLSQLIKKAYVFVLSITGTAFSGIVTLKGVLSNSVDTLSSRSVRFVLGQSLPIVGGAVSETYSSVLLSLGLIKNTVGVFGIITVIIFVAPTLIELLIWSFCLEIISFFAQAFGTERICGLTDIFKSAVTLLASTIIILTTIFIVCVGVCIAVRSGGI